MKTRDLRLSTMAATSPLQGTDIHSTGNNPRTPRPTTAEPSLPADGRTDQAVAVAALMDGFISRQDLCLAIGISERSLQRYDQIRSGPPKITIGNATWYRVTAVREWLTGRETGGPVRRR